MAIMNDIVTTFHSLVSMDKDTLHTVGYALYLYIMMDRFNHLGPKRARARHR